MDPNRPRNDQPNSSNPFSWMSEISFTPAQAAQMAAFASLCQQTVPPQQQPPQQQPNWFSPNESGWSNPTHGMGERGGSMNTQQTHYAPTPLEFDHQTLSSQRPARTTQGTNRKAPNWRVNEDIALCESWIRISGDAEHGNSQTTDAFWSRVWAEFQERAPGSDRAQRACEGRWGTIQAEVTKWRAIVKRVQRNRFSGTNPNDEWGACFVMFKQENTKDFKFIHCWEILRCSAKWNASVDEKETRDKQKGKRTPGVGSSTSHLPRQSFNNDEVGDHVDVNTLDADTPISFSQDNVQSGTPTSSQSPQSGLQRPMGRKAAKEKRRRSSLAASQSSCDATSKLNETVSAWRQTSENRFQSLKQSADEQNFHAIKIARLDAIQRSITITQKLAAAEEELMKKNPSANAEDLLHKHYLRLQELQELDKEHKEIRALQFSPGGRAATRLRADENNLDPCNLQGRFNEEVEGGENETN